MGGEKKENFRFYPIKRGGKRTTSKATRFKNEEYKMTKTIARIRRYYDAGTVQVYEGKFGWNWTRYNSDGTLSGNVGYGCERDALAGAREGEVSDGCNNN